MSGKNKVKCINCNREISGIKAARNDGWVIQDDGKIFCCCACISEYNKVNKKKKS